MEQMIGKSVHVVLKESAPHYTRFMGILAAVDERGVYLSNEQLGEGGASLLIRWDEIAYVGERSWFSD